MLEEPELLLGPWAAAADVLRRAVVRKRLIRAASGVYLGFVRHTASKARWSWLVRHTLQTYETEDASLLMTLNRSWGLRRTWDLYDAEEKRIGFIYRDGLWERSGKRLAVRVGSRFVGHSGIELAAMERRPEGHALLTFHPSVARQPFARMLLLAGALVVDDSGPW